MNYFFAVQPSEEVRAAASEAARQWRGHLSVLPTPLRVRWYDPADYHVTLKFLGGLEEVDDAVVLAGMEAAEKAALFAVAINGTGAFPDLSKPRVLWLGVEQNAPLSRLAASLDEALPSFTGDPRPYLPHLTLGRCTPSASYGIHIPSVKERAYGTFVANHLLLMQTLPPESRANGAKARYNTVHTFPFRTQLMTDI